MKCILDLDKEQLRHYLATTQQPPYRWQQIWHGLYVSYFQSWQEFSNLSQDLRKELEQDFSILPFTQISEVRSDDGLTHKVLFQLSNKNPIETVLMQYDQRISVCISSQSGCPIGCEFCATGKMGLKQNLSSGEIIAQILYFSRMLKEQDLEITNIVMMGMGEPFLNYSEVQNALERLNDHEGINIGARRITLSTIGIPSQILQFAIDFPQTNLAVSLHAPTNHQREQLIPINKKYPIEEILKAVREYIHITNRRVTFEYVMINAFNDNHEDALLLAELLQNMLCHVNLIPMNNTTAFSGLPSPIDRIQAFQKVLTNHHIPTTIRFSKGTQIQAGCGQLAGRLS
ncbi:MAG: 23S rRNA (adenine(2503)-C(2))-methyltransferase RlmN [Chloroflexi bacterium]|nr:23S rRNA (adenine(2503)-C(2))-methyltransferase RlmN [Chloroflexota bacterium]